MLWDESNLVVDRFNREEASKAVLLRMAVSSIFSEDGGKEFHSRIDKMMKG